MSHIRRFISPPALTPEDQTLLARHIAMDLLELSELCDGLSITAADIERLSQEPAFQALVARERRRLLTTEGRRDMLEWKQALTEGQYWDRLMSLGLNDQASATAIIDGMKVVKRPAERGGAAGGAGGPQFAVTINLGTATTTVVAARPAPPVIEGSAT